LLLLLFVTLPPLFSPFFFYKNGIIYLNEINPIPGSLANYLFDDFKNVIEKLAKKFKNRTKNKHKL